MTETTTAGSEPSVHRIVDGPGPLVRRRIVVWRRLEPGDLRTAGSVAVPESPFLEARVVDVAIPRGVHEDMKRLAAAKAKATAIPSTPMTEYEPAGIVISAAGGIFVGVWLDYLRPSDVFLPLGAVLMVIGVVVATIAKGRRRAAEAEAEARWSAAAEKSDYESLARDLAAGWLQVVQVLKKESGFHTEIRVAEGSNDPLRLASIDPRPMAGAAGFDPEDWLPTDGGGVRYEAVHAGGEIATRLLPGAAEAAEPAAPEDDDEPEEKPLTPEVEAKLESSAKHETREDAVAKTDADADSEPAKDEPATAEPANADEPAKPEEPAKAEA